MRANLRTLLPTAKPDSRLPTLIIDTREQDPLTFTRLASVRGTLQSGDYSIAGCEDLFAIERKSIADLVACCTGENRERFFRELHRLRGFHFKRLVVVGEIGSIELGHYRSRIPPQSVFATLATIEVRYNAPVTFCDTPEEAALRVESWAAWFAREIMKAADGLTRSSEEVDETPPIEPGREKAAPAIAR